MKNKGYTLLELLGVIVILSVLITLVFPSIINFIKKGNDTKERIINDLIISAAEDYINDNLSSLYLTSGVEYCVSIDTLVEQQYLSEIIDDKELYSKSVKVTYNEKTSYEIIDKEKCSICKLIDDADNSNTITPGDKYQCKVKDNMEEDFEEGYFFFVLSQESNGTTNLIMERNICEDGTVTKEGKECPSPWASKLDYNDDINYGETGNNNKGPITSMLYLYNATKDWKNVPNMIIDYKDENMNHHSEKKGDKGYGKIKTIGKETIITNKNGVETGKFENLKARLPRYDEVFGQNKCLKDNEQNCSACGSCPLWLANYLNNSEYITGNNIQNITGVSGYWLLSSYHSETSHAWHVFFTGIIVDSQVSTSSSIGVRPVININLN